LLLCSHARCTQAGYISILTVVYDSDACAIRDYRADDGASGDSDYIYHSHGHADGLTGAVTIPDNAALGMIS